MKTAIKVIAVNNSRYTLYDLVKNIEKDYHVSDLKQFLYDSSVTNPLDVARRDYMEFFVEKILAHAGDNKKPTSMSFHVKWLNYDDSHNTWEPWKSLRLCDALHCDPARTRNLGYAERARSVGWWWKLG